MQTSISNGPMNEHAQNVSTSHTSSIRHTHTHIHTQAACYTFRIFVIDVDCIEWRMKGKMIYNLMYYILFSLFHGFSSNMFVWQANSKDDEQTGKVMTNIPLIDMHCDIVVLWHSPSCICRRSSPFSHLMRWETARNFEKWNCWYFEHLFRT